MRGWSAEFGGTLGTGKAASLATPAEHWYSSVALKGRNVSLSAVDVLDLAYSCEEWRYQFPPTALVTRKVTLPLQSHSLCLHTLLKSHSLCSHALYAVTLSVKGMRRTDQRTRASASRRVFSCIFLSRPHRHGVQHYPGNIEHRKGRKPPLASFVESFLLVEIWMIHKWYCIDIKLWTVMMIVGCIQVAFRLHIDLKPHILKRSVELFDRSQIQCDVEEVLLS